MKSASEAGVVQAQRRETSVVCCISCLWHKSKAARSVKLFSHVHFGSFSRTYLKDGENRNVQWTEIAR